MCKEKNIHFQVLISLDGVREIHNIVRGKTNVFEKTSSTIDEIMKNKSKYCDDLELGCTIVKQNIHNLVELDTYAKMKNYNIKFRLGIENKRIDTKNIKNK